MLLSNIATHNYLELLGIITLFILPEFLPRFASKARQKQKINHNSFSTSLTKGLGGIILILAIAFKSGNLSNIGLEFDSTTPILKGVGVFLVFIITVAYFPYLCYYLRFKNKIFKFHFQKIKLQNIISNLLVSMISAVYFEILFRGYLYIYCSNIFGGGVLWLLISAALIITMQIPQLNEKQIVYSCLMNLVICLFVWDMNNITFAIAFHLSNNIYVCITKLFTIPILEDKSLTLTINKTH